MAKSLTPYCWERTYPVLRQQHQQRAATRLRKHDSLPTAKLSQIFHSTETPKSMNYGAIISILYFQGSDLSTKLDRLHSLTFLVSKNSYISRFFLWTASNWLCANFNRDSSLYPLGLDTLN